MDAIVKAIRFRGQAASAELTGSDSTGMAQYLWLNELPGLCFGLVTVVYIVASLISLI